MEFLSTCTERLIRRPPDADMPRQFLNDSAISLWVGTVVMVLSQFWILTVCRATSITSPSAPYWGISIQSPTLTMSFAVSCTLATRPRMVSLNTSSRIAVIAPRPLSSSSGERSMTAATTITPPMTSTAICNSCATPLSGRSRDTGKGLVDGVRRADRCGGRQREHQHQVARGDIADQSRQLVVQFRDQGDARTG